jgi:hypothetical protein
VTAIKLIGMLSPKVVASAISVPWLIGSGYFNQAVVDINMKVPAPLYQNCDEGDYICESLELVKYTVHEIEDAALPNYYYGYLAAISAEVVAGAVSGLGSRKIADILEDKKKDTALVKSASTGAFFGSRSVARSLLRIAGLPAPIALVLASFAGSSVSIVLKIIGRKNQDEAKKLKSKVKDFVKSVNDSDSLPLSNELTTATEVDIVNTLNVNESSLSPKEIISDILKWLVYDVLSESYDVDQATAPQINIFLVQFIFGATASTIANSIKQVDFNPKIAIEGGVLFSIYDTIKRILLITLPQEYNDRFFVRDMIDHVEKLIGKVLPIDS